MTVVLSPETVVVITRHADARLAERFGLSDLDQVRDEISGAIRDRAYAHRARCFFEVYAGPRRYPVALCDKGRTIVVMTVLDAALPPA